MLNLKLQYIGHLMWRTDSLEKTMKLVHPKGDQSWVFTGRSDAEAETPILWPPDTRNWLIWKDPDAGKDWRQEEKRTTEDEIVGWHHWLNGQEFEQMVKNREAWCAAVHGVTKSQNMTELTEQQMTPPWGHMGTGLSNFTTTKISGDHYK